MRMIMRLQHVVRVIVFVPLFTRGMTVAVTVLMGMRMRVRVRMLMIVNDCAVAMLMPVCMDVLVLVLMSVLVLMLLIVTGFHKSISFACLNSGSSRSRRVPRIVYRLSIPFQGMPAAGRRQRSSRYVPVALAEAAVVERAEVAQGSAARHVFADINILVRGDGEEDIVSPPRAGFTPVRQEAPASS
jgi:hypothetical protein